MQDNLIFVVEDDAGIRELVLYTLRSQGFKCEGFESPAEFWKRLEEVKPVLLILDLMLPDEDGMSVLRKLKADPNRRDITVMIVSARGEEFDKISGLDSGADDYVTKPFGVMELVSRVKVQLRRRETRSNPANAEKLTWGPVEVDTRYHRVTAWGALVELTLKEYELLVLFIKHPHQVFSREQLLNQVWGIDCYIESRTVDVHIRTLRMKLGLSSSIIETVRGVGYRLAEVPQVVAA